jgi:16S rRNA (uracil1498-N3)-methyltransferase
LQRWEKIALNAAEQSHRNTLPSITPISEVAQVLSHSEEFDLKLIASLVDPGETIQKVLAGVQPAKVLALIGPEGDFTPVEVEAASKSGFVPISLGKTVLRVDTAAIAVASYLKFRLMG